MTNGSIAELENDVLRNRIRELKDAALKLCDAVTRYVEPKKGDNYLGRLELLNITRTTRDCIRGGMKRKTDK